MALEQMRQFFLWCSVINIAMLMLSFLFLSQARGFVYKIHSKWFPMTEQQFNTTIYAILGGYKILIFVFNLIPYIALCIIL